ncbi:pilus assembly protein TadG-related protein [Actinotalea sp. Marseille-Q4924]|uniref:pilus assembly protein TadG-related protein n=1 Tax=Actinotalea sp. Marseille-Q4924 TaxID=2866571 RepID=UPI001CE4952C|nr:pilus assembly protein TadG-related protein [Actinotalea sp. Marseille-Q4924]
MTPDSAPAPGGPVRRLLHHGGDDGQIMLLSLCYAVIALLLVTVVVSASGVHLERKRLLAVADQAALAAADSMGEDAYYGRDPARATADDGLVVLTETAVRTAVQEHLERSPGAARLTGLVVVGTSTDGRTAEVTLGAVARPPLISWVTAAWSDGIALRATSRARAD